MKFRFEIFYWLGLALLLFITFWAVWANAQSATGTNPPSVAASIIITNSTANSATNLPATISGIITTPFQGVTFGLDRPDLLARHPILKYELLGQHLWKYLASLIYIVLAFLVAWALDFIVNVWLSRLAAKTKTQYDDLLLKLLRGPIKVVAFVILLNIGLGVFEWPARAQLFLSRGLIVAVACSITYVLLKMVDLMFALWREKIVSPRDKVFSDMLFPLLRNVTKVAIFIAAAALTAENLEIKTTSLLASISVGGLALGLAAQDTVANLFGAVAIFLDKPFYLGDMIKVEGVDGTVESIGLRSTRIRNPDGHHVVIPNKLMGNAIITNVTRRPNIRVEMNLGLTCNTPVEKVKLATAMLEEIFRASPKTADLIISFNKFTDSALNIYIVHVWSGTEAKAHYAQMQEWNLQIKQRFEAEKIELAFPTQTIYLKTDSEK